MHKAIIQDVQTAVQKAVTQWTTWTQSQKVAVDAIQQLGALGAAGLTGKSEVDIRNQWISAKDALSKMFVAGGTPAGAGPSMGIEYTPGATPTDVPSPRLAAEYILGGAPPDATDRLFGILYDTIVKTAQKVSAHVAYAKRAGITTRQAYDRTATQPEWDERLGELTLLGLKNQLNAYVGSSMWTKHTPKFIQDALNDTLRLIEEALKTSIEGWAVAPSDLEASFALTFDLGNSEFAALEVGQV